MRLIEAMQKLYATEINCAVASFWDGGFTVSVGDEMNGFKESKTFEPGDLDSAGQWLMEAAARHYDLNWQKT